MTTKTSSRVGYRLSKRALDIGLSAAALVATAPLTIPAAGAIYLNMGRPILFKQQRPGLHGAPFYIYKFRTMRAPKPDEDMLASDAQRKTRLGEFLRKTSIDELPALLNVLRGELSLVGPRPLLMQYLERYTPEQARRHDVPPGITGWAQVNGRNAISWEQKFELDLWYVEHASLALDLKILAMTVGKVLKRADIDHQGASTMPEFMGSQA